jgi:hypothetical protein
VGEYREPGIFGLLESEVFECTDTVPLRKGLDVLCLIVRAHIISYAGLARPKAIIFRGGYESAAGDGFAWNV